jgi:hypothetical protein
MSGISNTVVRFFSDDLRTEEQAQNHVESTEIRGGMIMMRAWQLLVACGVFLSLGTGPPLAQAALEVLPVSYSFHGDPNGLPDGSPPGTWDYPDETEIQLIDGAYGTDPWHFNSGIEHAYEWVGWVNSSWICIDFDFGTIKQLHTVKVGSYQEPSPGKIYLPNVSLHASDDAISWLLLDSTTGEDVDGYHTFMFGDLGFNNRYLRVHFDDQLPDSSDNRWIFTDEIDFYTSMPEPSTLAIWAILCSLVTAAIWRRRR